MKKIGILFGIVLLTLAVGCSKYKDYDKNIIKISKEGSVNETIQEPFDESIYQAAELKNSIESEIASYNSGSEESLVELKKCKVKNGIATVQMKYRSASDYASFNYVTLYHGSISEFVESEYHAYTELKDTEGEITPLSSIVASGKDYHVVVLDMDCILEVNGTICYVSDGVELITKKAADVTASDEAYAYIVYK